MTAIIIAFLIYNKIHTEGNVSNIMFNIAKCPMILINHFGNLHNICFLWNARYQTPRVWAVGVAIFIVVYIILMASGIWFYCKYCKGGRIVGRQGISPGGAAQSNTSSKENQITFTRKMVEHDEQQWSMPEVLFLQNVICFLILLWIAYVMKINKMKHCYYGGQLFKPFNIRVLVYLTLSIQKFNCMSLPVIIQKNLNFHMMT